MGAVPAAAIVAVVAAILARRHRRTARVLMGLAVVVLAGMLVAGRRLSEPFNELRGRQLERFAPIAVGLTHDQVAAALGEPDLRCPGDGYHAHEVMGTPELVTRLFAATDERWIYFMPGADADHQDCKPLHGDGEVGFNAAGQVIWFIELTGETFLTF